VCGRRRLEPNALQRCDRAACDPPATASQSRPARPQAHRSCIPGRPERRSRYSATGPKQPRRTLTHQACPHGGPGLGREASEPSLRLSPTGHRQQRTTDRMASAQAPDVERNKAAKRWCEGNQQANQQQRSGRPHTDEQGERKQYRRQRQRHPFGRRRVDPSSELSRVPMPPATGVAQQLEPGHGAEWGLRARRRPQQGD